MSKLIAEYRMGADGLTLNVPQDSKFLDLQARSNKILLWVLRGESPVLANINVVALRNGDIPPDNVQDYLGTAIIDSEALHCFLVPYYPQN